MKITANRKRTVFLFLLALAVAVSTLFLTGRSASAESLTLGGELKEAYAVGEIVDIPNGTIAVGGVELPADSKVLLPNGAVKASKQLLLEHSGIYTVVYSAEREGERYEEEKRFTAYAPKYRTAGLAAPAAYEPARHFDKQDSQTDVTIAGIDVELTANSVFYYDQIVDISASDRSAPLFKANVYALSDSVPAFSELNVVFTDLYNPDNYLHFILVKDLIDQSSNFPCYMRVGVNGQPTKGKNAFHEEIHTDGQYGTWVPMSFKNDKPDANDAWSFTLDYNGKKVYSPNGYLVADLAGADYFAKPWERFESGECRVSVYADGFSDISGNLFVQRVADEDGGDFADNRIIDVKKPNMEVTYGDYAENALPAAVIGQKYPVFDYDVFEFESGINNQSVCVYYDYVSSSKVNVTLKDGYFIPEYTGTYTIEYSATDYFGNVGVKTVSVVAARGDGLCVTVNGGQTENLFVAREIAVGGYTLAGVSGNATVKITASCGDTVYEIGQGLTFTPERAGEYVIQYSVSDYVGQTAEASYTITVTADTIPVFMTEPIMPKYVTVGFDWELPVPLIRDYYSSTDGAVVTPQITVSASGVASRTLESNIFKPAAEFAGKDVTITYTAQTASGAASKSYTVPCVSLFKNGEQGKIDKSKLFVTSGGALAGFKEISDGVVFASYAFTSDGVLNFANKLPAHKTSLQFRVLGGNFTAIDVILTDSVNPDDEATFSFVKRAAGVGLSINGGAEFTLSTYDFNGSGVTTEMVFDWFNNIVTLENGKSVFNVADGSYKGFSSGLVYLTVRTRGVKTKTDLTVTRVCNQTLTDSVNDNASPIVLSAGEYFDSYALSDRVTIHRLIVCDAINPFNRVSLTVYTPSRKIAADRNNRPLENIAATGGEVIELTEYGAYELLYTVNGAQSSIFLTVADRIPPEPKLTGPLENTYTAGTKVMLSATATDGLDGACTAYITVKNAEGQIELIQNGSEYTFKRPGNYTVTVFAFDKADNYGAVTYRVIVK